ncbi:tyrosine-type recombinase/integrase [Vibrio astriarenae]
MYLFKNRYAVYFVRVCTPKPLVKQGYPFDFKLSLQTKTRAVAIRRSHPIIMKVLESLDNIDLSRDCPNETKANITSAVNNIRASFTNNGIQPHFPNCLYNDKASAPPPCGKNYAEGYNWQKQFIASKQHKRVTHLTVHQLNQRTLYFLDYLKKRKLTLGNTSPSDLMNFGDHLHTWLKSAKTKKDYWNAAKQLVKWLCIKEHLRANPFTGITITFKSETYASEQRERWSNKEIKALLNTAEFQKASYSLKWTTMLLIYMGLRPSEACQLTVNDIKIERGMFVIRITDKGENQKLKNKHSLRTVPIPKNLIQSGFIDYVHLRLNARKLYLFDWKPRGADLDWTKQYRTQFGKIQTSVNMKPRERPTAYGFRHTFIDHLKQLGVEEYQVAELVGHVNPNMAYGRYGKKLTLHALKDVIEKFHIEGD